MSVAVRPRRFPRWVGGGSTTNASTNSRTVNQTVAPSAGDRLILVSGVEGTAVINSVTQTGVTWTKLAESALATPKVEIWLGIAGSGASNSAVVAYSGSNYGAAAIAIFEGMIGIVVGRADGSSNTMATFTATHEEAVVIFAISQNTFGAYYTYFSGRYMNHFECETQNSNQLPGAYWAVPGKRIAVSGTAQRSSGATGTLRSITLAVI